MNKYTVPLPAIDRQATTSDEWDARQVRALREFLGLTQGDFAAKLGIRQQRVSEWEVGKHQPRGASRLLLSALARERGFRLRASGARAGGTWMVGSGGGRDFLHQR